MEIESQSVFGFMKKKAMQGGSAHRSVTVRCDTALTIQFALCINVTVRCDTALSVQFALRRNVTDRFDTVLTIQFALCTNVTVRCDTALSSVCTVHKCHC